MSAASVSGDSSTSPRPKTEGRRSSFLAKLRSIDLSNPGQAMQGYAMDAVLTGALGAITTAPPRLPVAKNKEPLALSTVAINMRAFTQKSGPIFYFQDAVEATLVWDDWAWTTMWMAIWAVVEGAVRDPVVPNPPHEGEIRYYENLRDIQNMMKMVTDIYDLVAPSVGFLNWSSYPRSLLLLQISLVLTAVLFVIGPFVPLRPILLVVGELAFLANHPWVKPAVQGLSRAIDEERKQNPKGLTNRQLKKMEKRNREMMRRLQIWYDEDRLDDEVWERGWRDVEMFENERYISPTAVRSGQTPGWSVHNLQYGERKAFTKAKDGWSASELEVSNFGTEISRQVAMSLEEGWEWVKGDEWRIDWIGEWSDAGVDEEGYVYTNNSWLKPSPYPYGHAGQSISPPQSRSRHASRAASIAGSALSDAGSDSDDSVLSFESDETEKVKKEGKSASASRMAVTRRRRWLKRAVRVQPAA
ncbi:Peroxin/Dysferlin domain [Ceraceosorus bombacis]|uniref:Peroxin/Dysferlin domain n=1 Tax=Ceraceosorus bombacis TaxID=401625 RepID=A0A0N7LB61_9BASI|nr:Peroxin/Dysferlin domain [Ceraceosorus bombacis]